MTFQNAGVMNPKPLMSLPIFHAQKQPISGLKFSTNPHPLWMGNSNPNPSGQMPQRFGQYQPTSLMSNSLTINSNEDRIRTVMEGVTSPPESMKDYITRAYQKCLSLSEKNQMDKFLKKIINLSRIHNDTHSKDWRNHPLPTLPRERLEFNKEMNTANVFSIEEGTSKNTVIDPNDAISTINC